MKVGCMSATLGGVTMTQRTTTKEDDLLFWVAEIFVKKDRCHRCLRVRSIVY